MKKELIKAFYVRVDGPVWPTLAIPYVAPPAMPLKIGVVNANKVKKFWKVHNLRNVGSMTVFIPLSWY